MNDSSTVMMVSMDLGGADLNFHTYLSACFRTVFLDEDSDFYTLKTEHV